MSKCICGEQEAINQFGPHPDCVIHNPSEVEKLIAEHQEMLSTLEDCKKVMHSWATRLKMVHTLLSNEIEQNARQIDYIVDKIK